MPSCIKIAWCQTERITLARPIWLCLHMVELHFGFIWRFFCLSLFLFILSPSLRVGEQGCCRGRVCDLWLPILVLTYLTLWLFVPISWGSLQIHLTKCFFRRTATYRSVFDIIIVNSTEISVKPGSTSIMSFSFISCLSSANIYLKISLLRKTNSIVVQHFLT